MGHSQAGRVNEREWVIRSAFNLLAPAVAEPSRFEDHSSNGMIVAHYEREGEIKIGDTALDSPSEREIARRERRKRAASALSGGVP